MNIKKFKKLQEERDEWVEQASVADDELQEALDMIEEIEKKMFKFKKRK